MGSISSRVKEATHLLESGQAEEALRLANKELDEFPEDPICLYLVGRALLDLERPGLARVVCKRAVEIIPDDAALWTNLGNAYQLAYDNDEAEQALFNSLRLEPRGYEALNNLSLLYVNEAKPDKAISFANKALSIKDGLDAKGNKSFAHLMKGNWKEGWEGYEIGLGRKGERKDRSYVNPTEPRWNGEKGKTVVLFGEQGLGDEIAFASCVPDLMKDCKVIIDCDSRLEGLFKRSFNCPVYGTRYKKNLTWPFEYKIDARVAFGSLPRFYRNKTEDFPGTPYLVSDPERRRVWRAVLDQYPGKKIGVAWTGGIPSTGQKKRSLIPEMFKNLKGTLISLEYKERDKIDGIVDFSRFINTGDYDDTAALVSELDYVVSVTTTVVDLCGALGKECHVLVPSTPYWRYGLKDMPWYKAVKLYRHNKDWKELNANLHRIRQQTTNSL